MMEEATAPSVHELNQALQLFGIADYAVFAFMLLLCAAIGVYFGFFAGARSADDYLMGGRSMGVVPISMSLIASFISGITLLGTPTEIYLHGTQYTFIAIGVLLMAFVLAYAYLPVFHNLQLTSTYEYLERRFGKEARLIGSVLFVIGIITWIPIVIYVPALAFNQVTGVNVHVVTPLVCLVCIFYTCVGGLKAVVWTDVVQTVAMFGSMLLVIAKGTADVGGLGVVWSRNWESGRIESPSWDLDPTVRHTFWTMSVGGATFWLQTSGVNQNMMQRYLALPTRGRARASVCIFVLGALFLIFTCCYSGLLIYATYYDCDPLTTKLAAAKDQLLPLLVMRTLGQWPGLPGCFVAGVFSAALSSMSTAMNSMAAVVLEDFYKTFFAKKPLTDRQTNVLMKTVVVVTGVVCVSLVFVVEKLGSILQLSMSLGAMTNGPALGIFTMGLFLPWVNNKGMLAGSCAGLLVMGWIVLGAQAAIATGDMAFPTKPFSVQGCTYSFAAHAVNATLAPAHAYADASSDVFPLYRVSYLWYTLLGVVVSTAVALPVSFLTGANRPQDVDARLLSPVVRRFFRARSAPAAGPAPAANGYKSVELHIIPNSQSAEEKEKEAMLES
ncbi:hypothetical protein R5R35_002161 [Gryllus longicercus]|uniref:Sodium-coupled monocarboxylate transporter 1 n=1 Tax=Gryllus longicercus TaxID=2509291 RepID=A0AAN9VRP3_9ORTH